MKLVWRCDLCDMPIEDGDGYATVSYAELRAHDRDEAAWERRHDGKVVFTLAEFLEGPDPVYWQVLHRECDPSPDSSGYWIAVERMRSSEQLLDWCAHLLDKSWIQQTTWPELIRRANAKAGVAV